MDDIRTTDIRTNEHTYHTNKHTDEHEHKQTNEINTHANEHTNMTVQTNKYTTTNKR